MSIKERFRELDSRRIRKLERSRYVASLTVPSVLPPAGWTNEEQLPQPFSSIPARGVVGKRCSRNGIPHAFCYASC